jgi:hypothetical protein
MAFHEAQNLSDAGDLLVAILLLSLYSRTDNKMPAHSALFIHRWWMLRTEGQTA